MKLLGQTKDELDSVFGAPAIARDLLGDVLRGERAWEYRFGTYQLTVGFYADIARYAAFQKTSGGKFEEADLRTVLDLIAPWNSWETKRDSSCFDLAGKDGTGHVVEAHAWQVERYVFAFCPAFDGQPAVAPDKRLVDARF